MLALLALVSPLAAHAQPAANPQPAPAPAQPMVPVAPTVRPYTPPPGYPPPGYPPPGYPPTGYPPPGYPPPYPGWAPPPPPRWVLVEVNSDDPRVRIDRIIGNNRVPACYAPCGKMLDNGSVYVIEGDGVRATSQFVLPDDRDKVTLDVQAGSSARMAGGIILMGGGIASTYLGFLIWELGKISEIDSSSSSNNQVRTGQTMMLIGIPAAVLGLYLVISTHTTVNSSTGSSFTQDATRPRRRSWIAFTPRLTPFGLEF